MAPRAAERLARAPAALRDTGAGVIALQEVFLPAHRRFLIRAMRETHPYALAAVAGRSVLGSGLLFVSAVPIRAGGFVSLGGMGVVERGILWAELDHPAPRLLNVHLRADMPRRHATEVGRLLSLAAGKAILLGDFNCGPDVTPEGYDRILNEGFADAYAAAGRKEAPTWDAANPLNRRGRYRLEPSQRIDHVFVPKGQRLGVEDASIVLRAPVPPLSDHYGLLALLKILD